ncbi:MAG: DinB family protein [Nakamurella sp.]
MLRNDPDPSADERTTLTQFLDYQRATLLGKADNLSSQQMRQQIPTSTLTIAGLLKHLALVEDDWIQVRFLGRPEREPWAGVPWDEDRDWEFNTAVHDDPDELRARYQAACDRSRRAVAAAELDDLSKSTSREGIQWSLRWILTHLIEETARHNGHADFLREAIDGAVGE